jgi:hypothetical protein
MEIQEFLQNIKAHLPDLRELLEEISGHWSYEDGVYRFYHQSFKVYALQTVTMKIVEALKKLVPEGTELNPYFKVILEEGASMKEFKLEHNHDWLKHTRPMVEAFLHAKYFLEMAVKYGDELEVAPRMMPSGWAGLLYLFNMR